MAVFDLPVQLRSGTQTSPAFTWPASGDLTAALVSPTWATDDPTILVQIDLEFSSDGGASWRHVVGFSTRPAPLNQGILPGVVIPAAAATRWGPGQLRVVASVSKPIQLGVTVSF